MKLRNYVGWTVFIIHLALFSSCEEVDCPCEVDKPWYNKDNGKCYQRELFCRLSSSNSDCTNCDL